MSFIYLTTIINAPVDRCFDISRSIDVHQRSTVKTNERAIAGITKGLIKRGEQVTWRAKHFGIYQTLTTLISEMNFPDSFVDVQLKGPFKKLHHIHLFEQQEGGKQTIMKDVFEFESPMGFLGKLIDSFIMTNYLKGFLIERNRVIKQIAESNENISDSRVE